MEAKFKSQNIKFEREILRQTLNYLKASPDIRLGFIINFGTDRFQFKRVILTNP